MTPQSWYESSKDVLVRKKCLWIILVVSLLLLVIMAEISDRSVILQKLQVTNNPESLRQTTSTKLYLPKLQEQRSDEKTVTKIVVTTIRLSTAAATVAKTSTTTSTKASTKVAPANLGDQNKDKAKNNDNKGETDDGTKSTQYVQQIIHSDYKNESYLEPYCAMYSNSFKYLIWPDTPSDLTEWTYKRKRKCPKYVIPDNLTNTRRVKYSLTCDKDRPRLEPSFTTKSNDLQVVALNDTCLFMFTNSCCNDNRGVPNVVHYVWYFRNEMKFYMFLSMLSIIRYVRPCLILFHGEFLPYGKYWDYIIRIYPNILHINRPRPLHIFGKKIHHHEHSGDIMRLEALMELGGMYFDTDVIVLRDLEPLHQYNMTLCFQASGYMLNSFIMARKNTTFLSLWMEGYRKDFRNDSYVYNSMFYNGDLARNRSDLIHIEKGTLCAPGILIGKPFNSSMIYDWSKLYGYHLYARTIHVPWNVDWIKHFNSTVGSMVRQVVYGNKELCDGPSFSVV